MFDFAWSEILIIGGLALVVIGPKDLPKALKTVGIVVRQMRGLAREFQNSIDDMIRESELEELRKATLPRSRADIERKIERAFDPDGVLSGTPTPTIPMMGPLVTRPLPADPEIEPPAAEAVPASVPPVETVPEQPLPAANPPPGLLEP